LFICTWNKRQLMMILFFSAVFFAGIIGLVKLVLSEEKAIANLPMTEQTMVEYIRSFGWEVEEIPEEQKEIIIPTEWNEVYERYNEVQQRQGFDLSDDCGRKAVVTTFAVLNYPGHPDYIRIHLITAEDEILAADICSIELDGFLHGLQEGPYDGEKQKAQQLAALSL